MTILSTPPTASAARDRAFADFLHRYPAYGETQVLDELRRSDFARLDEPGHVYLDFTGGGLYAGRQVSRHADLLLREVLGNPHSESPTSRRSTELAEACRHKVLSYFNADPGEYEVIFTANASQSLKLVGESYPFAAGDELLLTYDNHNSVNGIREFDRMRGAHTTYVPVLPPSLRIDERTLASFLGIARSAQNRLLAYPAQSNFSGVQHPLEWIAKAQAQGWDVLLDAAAYVPTNRLDLSRWRPDYVALSFYKMFGYPTGVGALLARRQALEKLHRPWFSGGTINVASVQADLHTMATGASGFEDGTVNYTSLPAVQIGLELIEEIGIETIHRRVECLTGWLIEELTALRHPNGRPMVHLYGPRETEARGGTLAFNVEAEDGNLIDHQRIELAAAERDISLRTGCFCNPGAGEVALGLSREEIVTCFTGSGTVMTYEEFRHCIQGKGTGAVRASLGMISNFDDARALVDFLADFATR